MSKVNHNIIPQIVDMSIYLIVKEEHYQIKKWSIDKRFFIIDTDLKLTKDVSNKIKILFIVDRKKYYLNTMVKFNQYKEGSYRFLYRRISDEKRDILKCFVKFAIYKKGDREKKLLSKQSQIRVSSYEEIPNQKLSNLNVKKDSSKFFSYINFILGISD